MTETVKYILDLGGNLKTEAAASANALRDLGDAGDKAAAAVGGSGAGGKPSVAKASETAKVAIQGFKEQIGGAKAELLVVAGPAGIAAGAIGLTAAAFVKLANAAVEAKKRLEDAGQVFDTPGLDAYAAATTRLSTAWDRLLVGIGEGLGGPLSKLANWIIVAIEKWEHFRDILVDVSHQTGLGPSNPISGALGVGVYAASSGLEAAGLQGYTVGPQPRNSLAGFLPPPTPVVAPYVPAPDPALDYKAPPMTDAQALAAIRYGQTAADVVSSRSGSLVYPGLAAPVAQDVRVYAPPPAAAAAPPAAPPTPGWGAAIVGGIASGSVGGAAGALASAGPWGSVVGAVTDQLANGTLADTLGGFADSAVALVENLPTELGKIFQEVIPAFIGAIPELVAGLATLIPALVAGIAGSLDDIAMALIDAIKEIPKALAESFAELVGIGGSGGGRRGQLQRDVTFGQQTDPSRPGYDPTPFYGRTRGGRTEIHLHGQSTRELFERLRREQGSYGLGYSTEAL